MRKREYRGVPPDWLPKGHPGDESITGAVYAEYNELGFGLLESVYMISTHATGAIFAPIRAEFACILIVLSETNRFLQRAGLPGKSMARQSASMPRRPESMKNLVRPNWRFVEINSGGRSSRWYGGLHQ